MLPVDIIHFLKNDVMALCIGTRNEALEPQVCRGVALNVNDEGTEISVFLPKHFTHPIENNLKNNKRIALSATNPATFLSFQFKGDIIKIEDCSSEDFKIVERNLGTFGTLVEQFYGSAAMTEINKNINRNSLIMISFKIEDYFNQTPGPGTGNKLN